MRVLALNEKTQTALGVLHY